MNRAPDMGDAPSGRFNLRLLSSLFRALMRLYPPAFRSEFSEEMQQVFLEAADEPAHQGTPAFLRFALRELTHLLAGALHQKFNPAMAISSSGTLSNSLELALTLGVFALPAALLYTGGLASLSLENPGLVILAGVLLTAGILQGFPRWTLPYFGAGIAVLGYLSLFQWTTSQLPPAYPRQFEFLTWIERAPILWEILTDGLAWLGLFILTFIFLWLVNILRRFFPQIRDLWSDWTQISLLLYGEATIGLLLVFDPSKNRFPFAVASLVALAWGAALYLRTPSPRRQVLGLLVGVTLAMWSAAAGASLPESLPGLSAGITLPAWGDLSWDAARRAILQWLWVTVAILLPALLTGIMHSRQSSFIKPPQPPSASTRWSSP